VRTIKTTIDKFRHLTAGTETRARAHTKIVEAASLQTGAYRAKPIHRATRVVDATKPFMLEDNIFITRHVYLTNHPGFNAHGTPHGIGGRLYNA
jgi:hypothetical protein